jgi:hypothetical protein
MWIDLVRLEGGKGGVFHDYVTGTFVSAGCDGGGCDATILDQQDHGAHVRVVPTTHGVIHLTVHARLGDGTDQTVHDLGQDFEVAPTRLSLTHAPGDAGAVFAVSPHATLKWFSEADDAEGGMPMELDEDVAVDVLQGAADVATQPAGDGFVHDITVGVAGTLRLRVHVGLLAREVALDVVDPKDAVSVALHELDATAAATSIDARPFPAGEPGLASLRLRYGGDPHAIAVVFRDAGGRFVFGGGEDVQLDFGSVVTTSLDHDGLLRVYPVSLGASTVRVRVGSASAQLAVEVD